MTADTIAKRRESDTVDRDLANAFAAIVGAANVLSSSTTGSAMLETGCPTRCSASAPARCGPVPRLVCARRTRKNRRLVNSRRAARSR